MTILKGNYKKNTLSGDVGNDALYGYGANDVLNGGAGNDTLDGGRGVDTMVGGTGNDTYIVDNINDVVTEGKKSGSDTVKSSVNWLLGANLENLVLTGTNALNGTGNALANTITGNDANNILDGDAGNDILSGASGLDSLYGGTGNDTLMFNDFTWGDMANGGTGIDTLQISDNNQTIDLRSGWLSAIETIKFAEDSNSALKITAQSIIDLSSDSDTLTVDAKGENTLITDSGWLDNGIIQGYQTFTKNGATLAFDPALGNLEQGTRYSVSDAVTAAAVQSIFTAGIDEITIDFGGKAYLDAGLAAIDLSGFGLEDKLIIAQHDGALNNGTAIYGGNNWNYIIEETNHAIDRVSWQAGADAAKLISSAYSTVLVPYTYYTTHPVYYTHYYSGSSSTYTTIFTSYVRSTVYYSSPFTNTVTGRVDLTGLPTGLPDSQFVFV